MKYVTSVGMTFILVTKIYRVVYGNGCGSFIALLFIFVVAFYFIYFLVNMELGD